MSFKRYNARLKEHILGLEGLVTNSDLQGILDDTSIRGQAMIDAHNTQSNYLGGPYSDRGYSRTDLPLFFFGRFTLVPNTGNVRLAAPQFNISNLLIKTQDIRWVTTSGKPRAILKGGYATFLRYARPGKNLDKVDHTFTGDMLRNLTYDQKIHPHRAEVVFYVRPPHDLKAYYTHIRREWMGLFDEEIEEIAEMVANSYQIQIWNRLNTDLMIT